MNPNLANPVLITEEDYQLLKPFAKSNSQEGEMSLSEELKRAIIVQKDAFPEHAVRLNSKVTVMDLATEKLLEFTLVMPGHADLQAKKISILTPMGAALIGFRKGDQVQWQLPKGLKTFKIMEVKNNPAAT